MQTNKTGTEISHYTLFAFYDLLIFRLKNQKYSFLCGNQFNKIYMLCRSVIQDAKLDNALQLSLIMTGSQL